MNNPATPAPMTATELAVLKESLQSLLSAQHARVEQVGNRLFLLIGETHDTKTEKDSWWEDGTGERRDFCYIQWRVVANGKTADELRHRTEFYHRLCRMSWEDVFKNGLLGEILKSCTED